MPLNVQTHYFDGTDKKDFYRSYLIEDSEELHPGMKRPAVIVCPGGGYNFLSDREDEPLAFTFLQMGCQAFTLHYRIGSGQTENERYVLKDALLEFGELMKTIREHAEDWYIDTDRIFIIGCSAGAHLCACYSGMWHRSWMAGELSVSNDLLKPNACILLYPVIDTEKIYELMDVWGKSWEEEDDAVDSMLLAMAGEKHPSMDPKDYPEYDGVPIYYPASYVTDKNPATFVVHAADDYFIYVENTLEYITALASHRVSFESHIFEKGGHGFSLANYVSSNLPQESDPRTAGWVELARGWLISKGILG